jgi:hypothetical protein
MKLFGYGIAAGLMALYFVFITAKMSRSDGADQNLIVVAATLGGLAIVAMVALFLPRRD